ncbi:MAG TPA: alpha/beta hydrolase-fold protein [Anaerolineales bacterium]|nr:alpha/beta hydrolase-fold protein [Anaerolineales bacterium]
MKTRQATKRLATLLTLLTIITACTPANQPIPTSTSLPVIASQTPQPTATDNVILSSTPLTCLTQPGRLEREELDEFKPPQQFLVYLPPCYDEKTDGHYPVLYLLHGQTYNEDQWIRLGAVDILDRLILAGEINPFIVVFPDYRYWNLEAGPGFGDRLIHSIIPYVDQTYRTLPDRQHRALGGMSRGAGWSLRLGFTNWDLFGFIGLHSLAVMQKDASQLKSWIAAIPSSSRPVIFMDIGDKDQELIMAQRVESIFNDSGVTHEWHLYSGAHTEEYWGAHVEEYIRWYAEQWDTP